jgi:adenosylcobinamide-phosphate synthase
MFETGDPLLPLLLLLGALLLDWLIGDPQYLWRVLPHPVAIAGWLITRFDRALNRLRYGDSTRLWFGALTVLVVVGLAAGGGEAIRHLTYSYPLGWIAELILVAVLLAQRDLFDHVRRVRKALDDGGVEAGRIAVQAIVGRDTAKLDVYAVARAAVESLAENFSDGVVAPVFWYLLLGPAGIAGYKAINTLDSMIGHKTPHYLMFGRVAAKFDDAVNWIPARLSALLIAVAATATPGARPLGAVRTAFRDARHHRSPNAGWPEAAMAGALGVRLAGPRVYHGVEVNDHWMGDGRSDLAAGDVRAALDLYRIACALQIAVVAVLAALTLWR